MLNLESVRVALKQDFCLNAIDDNEEGDKRCIDPYICVCSGYRDGDEKMQRCRNMSQLSMDPAPAREFPTQ